MAHAAHLLDADIPLARLPGHWVLARLGKRVLRPGGLDSTRRLLKALAIGPADRVVEFAPGLGLTARRILGLRPAAYTAVERDESAARRLRDCLTGPAIQIVNAGAEASGLPDQCAEVVLGEAMLTMQPPEKKAAIVREAARLLRPGGRYGLHEIALLPEAADPATRQRIRAELSLAIHHGVSPLPVAEWTALLAEAGFVEPRIWLAPFRLLEPSQVLRDEGWLRAARIGVNLLREAEARRRVVEMRRAFRRHQAHLRAVVIIARKA
ncbi:MAG TPA: methyltransferase domain-containing protein [Candidatus Sumerlaeota bacterium]|nr:methyltransferase domain-containing protein [Candidatus Sumerlaeota bacterium]